MRTACTQCHAAKIRCSSNKDGCQRCNGLGLNCEYVVSMVGRMPKRQCKASDSRLDRPLPSPPESRPSEPSRTRSSTTASAIGLPLLDASDPSDSFNISRTTFGSRQPLTQTGSNERQLLEFLDDESWTSGGAAFPASIDDGWSFPPVTTFEIEGFSMPSDLQQPMITNGQSSSITTSVSESSAIPPSTANFLPMSPCSPNRQTGTGSTQSRQDWTQYGPIVALCRMVRLLEAQIHSQPTSVDEVMRLNQTCIRDVSKISSKTEYMQCRSCPALISTIMELIVTRYEDITNDQSRNRMSWVAVSRPSTPSLQFGVFELDPEEQALIRNRIIRKEAQKCVTIIRTLKQLLVAKSATGNDVSSQSHALHNWYDGMEKRMTDLISSLIPAS
ncbi:hypothetical protein P153DRAFT_431979 [Dothidotthia symphoricarpi CBS 119687]|uniref:Zn(2)-C6 fungal-type domain-containing protein n=1 Tax=Dothidotthia symphoricarpi CBS 119687 TaxID=1392245 RepID=A0A6A6ABN2_9PLEO|nr:uncharacterized protein P153DRAFT_431979 [Dothidotthia symphoricarpi CBS 119687]KAF2128298.1 hypothetical protein P153DRAFT_431979 [Dothidotthia symphoricarpi CBS 119687]